MTFKTYDSLMMELVEHMFPAASRPAGSVEVVVSNQAVEELRKLHRHLSESQLGQVLQADCGDWKKPEKIGNQGKRQAEKQKKGPRRAKKARRSSNLWTDDSLTDTDDDDLSYASDDSDSYIPVKKRKT